MTDRLSEAALRPDKPAKSFVACHLKLKLRPAQERMLGRWLWHLTGVYNWAIRKIQLDARDGIYRGAYDLEGLLVGHSARLGVPAKALRGTVRTAHNAWQRRFRRLSERPRLKGRRNRLSSIQIEEPTDVANGRVLIAGLGRVRFHAQEIPEGPIKNYRLILRPSGWHVCLVIQTELVAVPQIGHWQIGIDAGFSSLLTTSSGEVVFHPKEFEAAEARLGQSQRWQRSHLTSRLHERLANRRRDRNHKLSRRLVAENSLIAFSVDNQRGIARKLGKSVSSSGHYQLRQMLAYKSRAGGRRYVEVASRNSTRTCSACGALSGPTGWAGLKVRQWVCACGAHHDRDVNAAVNTLIAALGSSVEQVGDGLSGMAI